MITLLEPEWGYIVSLNSKSSIYQLISIGKYYTGLTEIWSRDMYLFFITSLTEGEAILGYGTIGQVDDPWFWRNECEFNYCKKHNFFSILSLKFLIMLNKPLLIESTPIGKLYGEEIIFHGLKLHWQLVDETLEFIENKEKKL